MLLSGSTPLQQPFQPDRSIPPHPHISGFARDLVTLAQFRHRPLALLVLQNEPQLLFHNTALSPWHALFCTRACLALAVSGRPVYFCQGCARSVPPAIPHPPWPRLGFQRTYLSSTPRICPRIPLQSRRIGLKLRSIRVPTWRWFGVFG